MRRVDRTVDQALLEQIVANVLAQLRPAAAPPRVVTTVAAAPDTTLNSATAPNSTTAPKSTSGAPAPAARPAAEASTVAASASAIELFQPVITAEVLAGAVRPGLPVKIGRRSVVTPSARDWLQSRKITWTRLPHAATAPVERAGGRWQLVVQTALPTVRSLVESLNRQPERWTVELVGMITEAVPLVTRLIATAERDGVAVLSEFADVIACQVNRNSRVRAAVITDRRHLELTQRHLGVNVVCINPHGRTFIELRNLLQDCSRVLPVAPDGLADH